MEKFISLFQDRPLSQAINYMAFFLLLTLVTPEQSTFKVIAGILLGAASIRVIIRFIMAWKSSMPATAANGRRLEDRLSETLIPVGFLVLAIVQVPIGSRVLPLLYFFLALMIVSGAVKLVCSK